MKIHFSSILLLSSLSTLSHALPFSLVPQGTLPTTVSPGGTVTASYTLTNNTGTQRPNNYVKYLPPNVTQVTTGAGVCGSSFTLAANGQPGDSCTLTLTVSGPVNAQAPQPQQHLFVCFPGGISCAGTDFPLNVTLSQGSASSSMVAGSYTNTSFTTYPLLATSPNGSTWTYVLDSGSVLPSNFITQGYFNALSCSGSLCAAAGSYQDFNTQVPMVALSNDGGSTWSYPIDDTHLPAGFSVCGDGGFFTTYCKGTVCLAGGNYFAFPNSSLMLAVGTQGGTHWSYAIDSTPSTLPDNYYAPYGGNLTGLSCNSSACFAAGFYSTSAGIGYPFISLGTSTGQNWSYVVDDLSPVPSDFNNGGFQTIGCSDQVCIAAGNYNTGTNDYPLIARSTSPWTSWTYTVTSSGPLPSSYAAGAFSSLNSVSCDGQLCVVGGGYSYSSSSTEYALLAVSLNGGNTWTYPVDASNPPLNYADGGTFSSVSCSGLNCVAGGQYLDTSGNQYPLIVSSQDGGHTWAYVVDKHNALPNTVRGYIGSVSCSGDTCMAAGGYDPSFIGNYPLLILSQDGGLTWAYEIDNSPSTLPLDSTNNSGFNGVSAAGP